MLSEWLHVHSCPKHDENQLVWSVFNVFRWYLRQYLSEAAETLPEAVLDHLVPESGAAYEEP